MTLEAWQLLNLVDELTALEPLGRSVALWHAAEAERSPDLLWRAPVGCRDRALLDLRAREIGPTLELTQTCERCAEPVEFPAEVAALRLPTGPIDNTPFDVDAGDRRFRLRHVSAADLLAVAREPRADLLLRCILADSAAEGPDRDEAPPLTATQRSAIDHALAAGDPQADIVFELDCPACKHHWSALLDIGEIVWTELQHRARRLLLEVDLLARVYHWSERQILELPSARRRHYLELAGA